MHKESYCILCDSLCHLIEHIIAHHLVLNNRILLSICLKSDTLLKLIHIIDMIHPLSIYNLKKYYSLYLSDSFWLWEHSFLIFV